MALAVDVNDDDIWMDFGATNVDASAGGQDIALIADGKSVVVDDDQRALGIAVIALDGELGDFNGVGRSFAGLINAG